MDKVELIPLLYSSGYAEWLDMYPSSSVTVLELLGVVATWMDFASKTELKIYNLYDSDYRKTN